MWIAGYCISVYPSVRVRCTPHPLTKNGKSVKVVECIPKKRTCTLNLPDLNMTVFIPNLVGGSDTKAPRDTHGRDRCVAICDSKPRHPAVEDKIIVERTRSNPSWSWRPHKNARGNQIPICHPEENLSQNSISDTKLCQMDIHDPPWLIHFCNWRMCNNTNQSTLPTWDSQLSAWPSQCLLGLSREYDPLDDRSLSSFPGCASYLWIHTVK